MQAGLQPSAILTSNLSQRGQHEILQRMLQEKLWRLLCFHKWGKHLPNFWLLLLLLLCVDLISIIRTKKKKKMNEEVPSSGSRYSCPKHKMLLPNHTLNDQNQAKKIWIPPMLLVIPVQNRLPQSASAHWCKNDHLFSGHIAVKPHGSLPGGFKWSAGLSLSVIPAHQHQSPQQVVSPFCAAVLPLQSRDTDTCLLWKATWLIAVAKKINRRT